MRPIVPAALTALAILSAIPAQADGYASLAGSKWGEGADAGAADVMVKFEPGNKVWGRLGCNRFTGTYTQDGDDLRFGTFATTRMACPEPQMKTEKRVGDALMAARKVDFSPSKLVLQDGSGKELLTLERRNGN